MPLPDQDDVVIHKQLHERVSELLRAQILSGELKPGDFIRQQHIAEQFGVSQMPVREALKELAAEGLVEHIPYRGVRVVEFSLEDIEDIFALRTFLEARIARTATALITEEELEILSDIIVQMETALATDQLTAYRNLNRQFHQIIYRASKSHYLIQTLDKLWATYPTILHGNFPQTLSNPVPELNAMDAEEHRAIVLALKERDAETVEQAMIEHIGNAGRELRESLQKSE